MPYDPSDNESFLSDSSFSEEPIRGTMGGEKRLHDRFEMSQEVEIAWIHNQKLITPIRATVTDISRSGCCFITRNMVNSGTCGIILLNKGHDGVIIRCFEAMHCRYIDGFRHSCGARWVESPAGLQVRYRDTDMGPRLDVA